MANLTAYANVNLFPLSARWEFIVKDPLISGQISTDKCKVLIYDSAKLTKMLKLHKWMLIRAKLLTNEV